MRLKATTFARFGPSLK